MLWTIVPRVPEVFLVCDGNFRPKADKASAIGRSHKEKPLAKPLAFYHPVDL